MDNKRLKELAGINESAHDDELKEKLEGLSTDDALKVIYGWVKQNHVSLSQFKMLIKGVL